jgi:hypothetical protein
MKYDLTVVLPSIRKERLSEFYSSLYLSMGKYHQSFELIIVSPYNLPEVIDGIHNIKLVKDFGSPARCVQIGTALAEGEFVTWSSDDALYYGNALEECLDLLKTKTEKDAIIVRYSEGVGRSGQEPPDNYWVGKTHPDHRLPFVGDDWNIAPVGLYYTKRFYELGGLDCRFEHANMNSHDLCYRNQKDGGKYYKSPSLVMGCDQEPGYSGTHGPIEEAYHNNDCALFAETWSNPREVKIPFDNWKDSPSIWKRRFK